MGWHVTLALHGIANFSRGVSASETSLVVRLRDLPHSKERLATDLVIVRSREELQYAVNTRLDRVMIISNDCVETFPEIAELPHVISVSSKFDYLSDGDVVGFQPRSKRLRTLYRRTSEHNSF
jgi:hypothetical protein